MQKNYTASHHESDVYQSWKESGLFNPDVCAEQGYCTSGENFSIVLPPPNVTGQLHLGHAAMAAFQDIMVRYHRMKGDKTLWLPGTDHAAIATQSVVEKSLVDQGMPDRKEMGREKFLDHCWDWTHKYRDRINGQISAMGSSLDWSREKFTLDLEVSESVENIFHDMYRDGLIYRGARMVNWCPKCESTLSDDEVDHKDVNGKMYHMLYEIQDFVPANTDQKQNLIELNGKWHLTIATTRPETLFGDTAVAVHPEDTRFNFLVGQKAVLPFIDRVIPIIGDDYVNMEKGTGCLKVTPGHDPNDYKIGQRHKLETINVFHDNAHLNEQAGKFENVERFIARKQLIAELQAEGKIPEVKENPHSVGHCYRHGDTPIEPLVSPQWFVDVNKPIASRGNKSLKELMLDAVRSGETELVPDRFNKVYYNWIEDLEDWCISRQIWWGHRIPVWYDHAGNICVDRALAEKEGYRQDEDTLDTWFSSGLWPFSTLDGPKDTADMRDYFPNSVLETGHDIIFFWVARMILMSTYALGKSPFKTVYMHGMVCDEKGKKMSKSKGNGVDPLDMTAKYGADALRFSLVTGTTPGNQINVGESKIEGYRNFITKLWNIYRYGTHNLFQDFDLASDDLSGIDPIKRGYILEDLRDYQLDVAEPANAWIILKTDQLIEKVTGGIENYRFGEVGEILYDFAWNELADWYLEASKKSNTQETKATLLYVLETLLKLLHPYVPFVTEMLYKELGGQSEFLMVAPWPQSVFTSQPENIRVERNGQEFELPVEAPSEGVSGSGNQLADQFETMQNIVTKIRSARADAKVNPVKKIDAMIVCKGETLHATSLQNQTDVIKMMANLNTFTVENTDIDAKTKQTSVLVAVSEQITVYLPLAGMVEKEEELARLSKEQANLEKQKASIAGKLGNQGFVANAPEAVITQQQEKLAEIEGLLVSITQQKIQIEQL